VSERSVEVDLHVATLHAVTAYALII